jgi:hypothetical protein
MVVSAFVYRLAPAVAACLALFEAPHLYAQNTDLPETIRVALVRYADLAPLAVTWTQTIEATPLGREKITTDVLNRILSDSSSVQQLAYRDGRIYMRRETKGVSSWPPSTDEIAFDGKLFYAAHNLFYAGAASNGDPKDRPYLHKWLPKNDDPQASYFQNDYFRAADVRLPVRIKELTASWHPQSELLALLAAGGRVETVGPIQIEGCALVRVQLTVHRLEENNSPLWRYDFYLDPERGYAVRRLEIWDEGGRLLVRSNCTEFEQLSGRLLWMPRLCRVEEYTVAATQDKENSIPAIFSSPLYVKLLRVNAFGAQPWPDDRFQLKYTTPGAYVNDASFPETSGKDGVFYQIPANPQRLDEVIAVRRAFYQAWRSAGKKSRPLRVLFLVLNSLGLAGVGIYFFVRRRKKASCT